MTYVTRANAVVNIFRGRLGLEQTSEAALEREVYGTFGESRPHSAVTRESQPVQYGFTRRQWDPESGTYFYRARQYSPALGRFLSKDPIGFSGGDTNLYRYVMNYPITKTDPSGLSPQDIVTIGNTFTGFVNNLVSTGQRLPGNGYLIGALNNMTWTAQYLYNGSPTIQGCAAQTNNLTNQLKQMQSDGQISGDFFFFPQQTMTVPGFEHNFSQAVSPADNVVITLDSWLGIISSQPIRGGK